MPIFNFNYIITTHNKENLIKNVLESVLTVSSKESHIYIVLDGCTDNTEKIIDQLKSNYIHRNIYKLYAEDVHELRSINIALKHIDLSKKSLNVILQDDIILLDNDIEKKLEAIYSYPKLNLGIISFRHGANLSNFKIKKSQILFPIKSYIETEFGHKLTTNILEENKLVFRQIAIKSPICIPSNYINKIGFMDEKFAPWDDLNYSFRGTLMGFKNAVFSLKFRSDVSWGTMRNKIQKMDHDFIVKKNVALFKKEFAINFNNYLDKKEIYFLSKVGNDFVLLKSKRSENKIKYLLEEIKDYLKISIKQFLKKITH